MRIGVWVAARLQPLRPSPDSDSDGREGAAVSALVTFAGSLVCWWGLAVFFSELSPSSTGQGASALEQTFGGRAAAGAEQVAHAEQHCGTTRVGQRRPEQLLEARLETISSAAVVFTPRAALIIAVLRRINRLCICNIGITRLYLNS